MAETDIPQLLSEQTTSGLGNLGMTCYVNTALQCLGHCQDFLDLILNKRNVIKNSTPLANELQEIYKELWVNRNAIAPYKFLKALQDVLGNSMNVIEQNDICEFLMLYLDKLNNDLSVEIIVDDEYYMDLKRRASKYPNEKFANLVYSMDVAWINYCKKEYSPIIDLLYGQQVSQIICGNCKYIHHNYEAYNTLSLPIPTYTETTNTNNDNQEPTIYDSLNILFKTECLNQNEKEWKCDQCTASAKSSKCTRLWKLPKLLIMTIKRFDHTLRKNTSALNVPETLNMRRYKIFKDTYEDYQLKSICFHYGSANSGHYVAFCKHVTKGWQIIDDEHIKAATDQEVDYAKRYGYIYMFETT